jgi:hypothetical protein
VGSHLFHALLSGSLLAGGAASLDTIKAAFDLLKDLFYRDMPCISSMTHMKRYALARFRAETSVGAVWHGVQEVSLVLGTAALSLVIGRGKVGRRGRR